MSNDLKSFSEIAKGFAKNPLGIIALFIVLIYGFASLVTVFTSSLTSGERLPLIYFLVLFPVLVLGVFGWLVSRHSGKLYGPSDYKNEENYIRMQLAAAASLAVATARRPEAIAEDTDFTQIADAVRDASPSERISSNSWRNRILWVDDRPENNVYERKAFEALGLSFSLALSTNEALEILRHNKFAAVISDMGRREGPREGYVLLEAIRREGNKTPFFIYAGSNLPEHRQEAAERGAQGSTNDPQELFELVTKAIIKRASE
jgi:CheY-like chemotaxis protein